MVRANAKPYALIRYQAGEPVPPDLKPVAATAYTDAAPVPKDVQVITGDYYAIGDPIPRGVARLAAVDYAEGAAPARLRRVAVLGASPTSAASTQSFRQTVLGMSPAGFWRFGECRGTFANIGSAAGVATPATSLAASGGVAYLQSAGLLPRDNNKAVYVPGTNDARITVPNHALFNTAAFSFCIGVRCDQAGRVIMTKDFSNSWRVFVNSSSQIRVDALGASVSLIATADPIQLGRHYWLAVTYDGTTCSIYLDGRLVKRGAIALANTYAAYATFSFSSTSTSAWNGILDEALWFNRMLSHEEVLTLYNGLSQPDVDAAAIDRLALLTSPLDALHRQLISDLRAWFDWGLRHGVKCQVGELGWPDDTLAYGTSGGSSAADHAQWDALAQVLLAVCDAYKRDRTYWDASHRRDQYLALLRPHGSPLVLDTAAPQAAVYLAHPTTADYVAGLNLSSPTLGAPGPSAAGTTGSWGAGAAGTLGATGSAGDYSYEDAASLDVVLAQGGGAIGQLRVGTRHERLAPTLGGALAAADVAAATTFFDDCRARGLPVNWILHNFGQYWLSNGTNYTVRNMGSAEFTVAHYQDVLSRTVTQWNAHMGVAAIELVSEPSSVVWSTAAAWETVAQSLVDTLRTAGWKRKIIVPTWNYSRIDAMPAGHPRPWINDALDNVEYSIHTYWEVDRTGVYLTNYADSRAAAAAAGY